MPTFTQKAEAIRDNLRKWRKSEFLNQVLEYLHRPLPGPNAEAKKMPSIAYLAIEWLYQVEESKHPRSPTQTQVIEVLQNIYELDTLAKEFDDPVQLDVALRKLVLAQLWYQKNAAMCLAELVRTFAVIDQVQGTSWFEEEFRQHYKVEMRDVVLISMVFTVHVMTGGPVISSQALVPKFVPTYEPGYFAKIIRLIAKPLREVAQFLKAEKKEPIALSEYFKDPLLLQAPAIIDGRNLIAVHRPLFTRAMGQLIRQLFIAIDKPNFVERYTKLFEQYVGIVMQEAEYSLTTEQDIEQLYAKHGVSKSTKKVDFIVREGKASIYVDAKGVDPVDNVKTASDKEYLFDKCKQIAKAIGQGFCTAKTLEEKGEMPVTQRDNRYMIVVTNQDFGVPDGTRLGALKDRFYPDVVEEYGDLIDPKKTFIMAIEDFEGVCKLCSGRRCSLQEFLDYCAAQDSKPETRRMAIRQHIDEYSQRQLGHLYSRVGTQFLQNCIDQLHEECSQIMEGSKQYWVIEGDPVMNARLGEWFEVETRFMTALNQV